jgi:phosphoenolpyruvate carboxykinase (ATP)
MPKNCPGVPAEILSPRKTWEDTTAYDKKAETLARQFIQNFEKFSGNASDTLKAGGPQIISQSPVGSSSRKF